MNNTISQRMRNWANRQAMSERIKTWANQQTAVSAIQFAYLLIALFLIAFPLFWMVNTALRPEETLYTSPVHIFPQGVTLDHVNDIFTQSNYVTYYVNSVIVAAGVVLLTTVSATLGGYGLARLDIPYKKLFARGILFGYMFPAILLGIPMFILWHNMGIINSFIGLILAETALALPFSIWLMWQFFQTVPESLEESAQMAGASRFRAFYEIALPMAKPGMVAIGVFSFAVSWNNFTLPTILMVSEQKWVLTIGVFTFTQQNAVLWGEIMAASAMMLIPSILFVYFLQKYLLRGFRIGGVG